MASDRILGALALVLLLASCGVDGPPERPKPRDKPSTGASVTLSGEAGDGVVGGS